MWVLITVVVVLAVGFALLGIRSLEKYLTYKPRRDIEEDPSHYGLAFEEVAFTASDGCRLSGWWIPTENAIGTVLFCHGNAGNVGGRSWIPADFKDQPLNFFMFDYRGYGKSKGHPHEQGTYRDAIAAYEVVRARHGDVDDPPVVLLGRSLGGAIAIQLALDRPVKGLIVESSFTSTHDMSALWYPWLPARWFARDRYDSIKKIGQVAVPKIIAHSPEDTLVPFEMGQQLFEAARAPKEFHVLIGSHGEAGWTNSREYRARLVQFMMEQLGGEGDT